MQFSGQIRAISRLPVSPAGMLASFQIPPNPPRVVPTVGGLGSLVTLARLPKCKGIGADTGIEEFDLEDSVRNGRPLTDQLIEPHVRHASPALGVDVGTVIGSRWMVIDPDTEANWTTLLLRPHDQMKIAGMEAVLDAASRGPQLREFPMDQPVAFQGPVIEWQGWRCTAKCVSVLRCDLRQPSPGSRIAACFTQGSVPQAGQG
jgi:hypothetical protein